MEQHIPLGMQTVLNVMPSKQPPAPSSVPGLEEESTHCELLSRENFKLKEQLASLSKDGAI